MTRLAHDLAHAVGSEHVLHDADVVLGYETDWLGRRFGRCAAVVRPASTQQVATVLQVCREHGIPVVPQGGNTGLVGGGVPVDGEVVLSTTRLVGELELDEAAGHVTLPAGARLGAVQRELALRGLELGIDLASRESATVGGLVATNAGGLRVPKFGHVRQQLVGLQAVLADGSRVTRLSGLLKDNSGYDLSGLLCGSEGTLGVVIAARLRVVPVARQHVTAVLGFDDLDACVRAVHRLRDGLPTLECAEVVLADGVRHAVELGARRAFAPQPPVELLVDVADRSDVGTPLVDQLLAVLTDVAPLDACVAVEPRDRAALWERRERHPEIVGRLGGTPLKLDTAVPLRRLPDYARDVRAAVATADPAARLVLYGHVADGNLHVNVASSPERARGVRDAVFQVVRAHQGSISAEHGIGRDKRDRLGWTRSAAEVATMRAVKTALDPTALLNPGVLLPPDDGCASRSEDPSPLVSSLGAG